MGPFILDTGASGLVITGRAAETLGLRAFGEVFVSGVAGKVPCRFRRAGSLTLGPVTVDAPVFMEMDVGGIVSGASEPVAGIVGFDAFKSSVLEVGPGGSPVRLYDPATFVAPAAWRWRSLLMVSNVPHVAADFAGRAKRRGARVHDRQRRGGCRLHLPRARRRRTRPATATPTRGRRRREVIVARAGRRREAEERAAARRARTEENSSGCDFERRENPGRGPGRSRRRDRRRRHLRLRRRRRRRRNWTGVDSKI